MIAFVFCTGPSLTQADVDLCRGRGFCVAVSDAFYLAPWADALVSYDKAWWRAYPEAKSFSGAKYHSHVEEIEGVTRYKKGGSNSGCMGLLVAAEQSPTKIILIGADMQGTHFFGPHNRAGLRNTSANQFSSMRKQFSRLNHLPVVNCSRSSTLTCFRRASLEDELAFP